MAAVTYGLLNFRVGYLSVMTKKAPKDEQLDAAKREQQALSRALVRSGARTQESIFHSSRYCKITQNSPQIR